MHDWTPSNRLIRVSIALVWFYQGLWCKVLGGVPRHEAVISAVPFIGAAGGHITLMLGSARMRHWRLGVVRPRMREAANGQTVLLVL